MSSQLINWAWVVDNADSRESLPERLLDTYDLVASHWDDDECEGTDIHVYEGYWGVFVLPLPYALLNESGDDWAEPPDPWSDEYREAFSLTVDGAEFYTSFAEAAAAIRESEDPVTTPVLPELDRLTLYPPDRSSSLL